MTPTARRRRPGYTLMELIAVVAILMLIGGILAPTFNAFAGNTRAKAGADVLMARMADARAAAIEQGRTYRVAVSADGTRVRVTPDDLEFAVTPDDGTTPPVVVEDEFPQTVTVAPVPDPESPPVADQDGWVRVATFRPDGTCREDSALIEVHEPGSAPLTVVVRGLTGCATVLQPAPGGAVP